QPSVIAVEGRGDSIKEVLEANPSALQMVVGKEIDGSISHDSLRKSGVIPLPPLSVSSDDALIMYTSGTTGKPKGAIITHANIIMQHYFINAVEWGISRDDRYLVTTPLAHRTGFARLANSMTLGGTLVVMKKFEPKLAVETIAREGITVAGMVPTVCRMLLPEIKADPSKCASLRRIVVTGEAFPVELK